MKGFLSSSFRNRLFVGFLAASLIPLLLCSALLLQFFRVQLTGRERQAADSSLGDACQLLEQTRMGFMRAAEDISRDEVMLSALRSGTGGDAAVLNRFLELTAPLRAGACLELYTGGGERLYSTRNGGADTLPTGWGVLRAAGEGGAVFLPEDGALADGALLTGAVLLPEGSGGTLGYLLIRLTQSDLSRLLVTAVDSSSDLLLLSSYWRPVFCTQPGLADSLAGALRARLLSGAPLSEPGGDFSYTVRQHEPTGLTLVLRQPQVFTRDTMNLLYAVSIACALVCLAAALTMSFLLSRQLFRPVKRLHEAIEEVAGNNNLDVYVQPEHNDELGALAERFNGMLVALKRNQEQLVENQRSLNEAQIRMLQAQLNPHFLCNTLDTIKWDSKINNAPQTAVMATDLADILRFCIAADEFVPLSSEIEIAKRYAEIQRIRFSSAFALKTDVPPELEGCRVPKMLLQPIVENAIIHGLEGVAGGEVEVIARAEAGVLSIRVEDNGRGLPPELEGRYSVRGEQLSRGHLGLYNVDTILRKYYGDSFGLCLANRPGGAGAVVTATLPLNFGEGKANAEGPCS